MRAWESQQPTGFITSPTSDTEIEPQPDSPQSLPDPDRGVEHPEASTPPDSEWDVEDDGEEWAGIGVDSYDERSGGRGAGSPAPENDDTADGLDDLEDALRAQMGLLQGGEVEPSGHKLGTLSPEAREEASMIHKAYHNQMVGLSKKYGHAVEALLSVRR